MTERDKILALSCGEYSFLSDFRLALVSSEADRVCIRAEVTEAVRNNYGFAHGGFLMALADVTAGLTSFTEDRRYVTQNAGFQFLKNVKSGTVYSEGTVLRRGKTVAGIRVEITDENGTLLVEGLFSMFRVEMEFVPRNGKNEGASE